jgi:hypothetical protein
VVVAKEWVSPRIRTQVPLQRVIEDLLDRPWNTTGGDCCLRGGEVLLYTEPYRLAAHMEYSRKNRNEYNKLHTCSIVLIR